MRCPILVGRDELAAELAVAVGRVAGRPRGAARGQVLVLAGEAGIGKSRLAEHLAGLAGQAGLPVAAGRAAPGGIGGAIGPVTELLAALTRDRRPPAGADLAPYLAVLASVLPAWRRPDWPGWSGRPEPVAVVAEAVLRVLRWAAGQTGLTLIMEDLHWADDDTLAVTRYLADHVSEIPAVLLVTVRTADGRDDVATVLGAAGADVRTVRRLTAAETLQMALACSGSDAAKLVAEAAEGLPLLVEDLLATGDLGGPPPRFADTVRARLARLDDQARLVIAAAAVLGRDFDWRLLPDIAAVPEDAVSAALRRSAELQLVVTEATGFSFRHALTREVVLAELAAPARRDLSLTAADALAGRPAAPDTGRSLLIARLLADAAEPERATRLLLDAGRAALLAGDLGPAERLLREAALIQEQPARSGTGPLGLTVTGQLAQVLLEAGQPAEAAKTAARTLAAADGREQELASRMRLLLARAAAMSGRWEDALATLSEVRNGNASQAELADVAVIDAQVALGSSRPASRASAEHLAAEAVGIASEAGRPDLACEALETLGSCARLRDLGAAAAAYRRALAQAEAAGLSTHRLRILNELGTVEMLMDARGGRLRHARDEALRAGAVGLAVGIGVNIAALHAMTASFDAAIAQAGEVEHTAARLGLTPLQGAALLMQGFAMAHQGRDREMSRYLAAAEAACPDDADLRAGAWGIGRALCALLAEDRDGARHALARARQEAPDQHARILNPYEGPELLLRVVGGEIGQAEVAAAAAGLVASARWPQLWHLAAQAVACGAAGDERAAGQALTAALDAAARYPVFTAIISRLVAEAAIRDHWGAPEPLLHNADATFTGLRLGRASAACRALLKAAGQPAPRRRAADAGLPAELVAAGVTAREAEVLDLLGERLSNREIAGRLFLSPRTVEKHVAALLQKLGADSRTALAARTRGLR